ncbi:MAG: autotransporter-associated beta strand repeat-containing protein [Bacteroidetes bacterium]|nr:autotransporter-associated beta strand repeat-containing protein [Bacteroidota bacterium]
MTKRIPSYIFYILLFCTLNSFAATYTWDGSSSNAWNTAANWDLNGVPPAGSDLVFPAGASNISTSNDIAAGTSFASITFGVGASAYTVAGNDIILSGGASAIAANNTSLTMTISLNITFSTAAPTIAVASGGTLTISGNIDNGGYLITHSCTGTSTLSGVISGTGGLTKTGAGDLTLSGTTSSYTGVTTSSGVGGELKVYKLSNGGSNSSIGASSNSAANLVFDGGRFGYYGSGDNTDRLFTLGTVASGAIIRHSGTGDLSFTNTAEISYTGASTRSLSFWGSTSYLGTFAPIIGDGAGGATAVIKDGTGTWLISGANTYTGLTTIDYGTLRVGSSTALGTVAAGTTMTSGNANALDLNGITYSTAEALTISGTGISSGGAVINSSATAATFAGLVTLGAASSIVGGTGTIAISNAGTITGSGNALTLGGAQGGTMTSIIGTVAGTLTKQDAGTWYLIGSNTYTGTTTISGGVLTIGNSTTTGAIAGASIVNNATLAFYRSDAYTYSGVVSGTGFVAKGFAGTTTLTGDNTYTGQTQITNGTLQIGNGGATGSISGTSLIDLGSADNSQSIIFNRSDDVTYSQVIQAGHANANSVVEKKGTGILTLSGANTYIGSTIVTAGTIKLGAAGVIPDASATGVAASGILDMNGFNETVGSITGAGTIDNKNGAGTYTLTNGGNGRTTTFSGIIQNTSGSLALTKTGIGALTLSGANTYAGATTISAGTLKLGAAGVIPDASAVTVTSPGILDVVSYSETIGSLAGTGTVDAVTGAGTPTLTCGGDGTSTTFSGIAQNTSGTLALTKAGAGTLTLSGANTYTGTTTITAGTLQLGAAARISNSSNVVMNGGYLSTGSGVGYAETVGTLTLSANSRIVLGTGSHALHFAASEGTTWTAATLLRVTGWQGNWNCTTGTSGQIYTGSSAELTTKLNQIFFTEPTSGTPRTACQLASGEIVPTSTLPVKLVSFTDEKGKNFNELFWITASEINSDYFEIQRSSDAVNFENIGKVQAAGNSNDILSYTFVDYEQPSGTSYYRLKQYDYDGQNETFNIVAIDNNESSSEFKMNALFPNPTSASMTVNFQSAESGSHFIFINDAQGNEVFAAMIATLQGENQFVLPTQNYASGTYFVRIVSPKKETISSQIVVQH